MADIQETLATRQKSYGDFITNAENSQDIQRAIIAGFRHNDVAYTDIDADMKEAIQMISTKLGRISNGDPWHSDSWHDIAGYAQLVADRLQKEGF